MIGDQIAEALRHGLAQDQIDRLVSALREVKPTPEAKATKLEANYRESTDDRSCGGCTHFSDAGRTGGCELVVGTIDPSYVCDWFESPRAAVSDRGGSGDGDRGSSPVGDGQPDS